MRLFGVAYRIFSLGDVDGLVRHHLDVLSVQDAFRLLGHHIRDSGLLGVEIVAEFLHGVALPAVFHCGHACNHARGIFCPPGEDCLRLHVIFHVVCRQLHVAVCHSDVSVIIYHPLAVGEILDYGITRRGECGHFEGALPEECDRIGTGHRVCPCRGIRHCRHRVGNGSSVGDRLRIFGAAGHPVSPGPSVFLR